MRTKGNFEEITEYSGTSHPFGKAETIDFIENIFSDKNSRILDVGPGQGVYCKLLKNKGYHNIDAVEIYYPYISKFKLRDKYCEVFHSNIVGFEYECYDIVIMGDIIEHLSIKQAKQVIKYAQVHSKLVLVAVPYLLPQIGCQLDGSGDHRQPDLTQEIFLERYKGFKLLLDNEQVGVFYSLKDEVRFIDQL